MNNSLAHLHLLIYFSEMSSSIGKYLRHFIFYISCKELSFNADLKPILLHVPVTITNDTESSFNTSQYVVAMLASPGESFDRICKNSRHLPDHNPCLYVRDEHWTGLGLD